MGALLRRHDLEESWGWRLRLAGFFFQAEDGIRDDLVTGVQTCALPISRAERLSRSIAPRRARAEASAMSKALRLASTREIGRASCRERVQIRGAGRAFQEEDAAGSRAAYRVTQLAGREAYRIRSGSTQR